MGRSPGTLDHAPGRYRYRPARDSGAAPARESGARSGLATTKSADDISLAGEPGIGKTTAWFEALEQARARGFRVLAARPAKAESQWAYASLADLLTGIEAPVWDALPRPQRLAIDRVLLRAESTDLPLDCARSGRPLLSILELLADHPSVVLAIDDLQWVDSSSIQAIAFAARRLTARLGLLATARSETDGDSVASWLHLPRPDAVRRIPALSLAD